MLENILPTEKNS